ALQIATMPLTGGDGASIAPETLTVMASATAGHERLRFAYRTGDGTESRRLTEPYRLVSTGRRWYLVAYDIDREDWRTFRVDRIAEPFPTGARFVPRELPKGGAAEFIRQSVWRGQEAYEIEVTFAAPAEFVTARLPSTLGAVEPLDAGRCRLRGRATDSVEWLAVRLAVTDCDFTAHGPPELIDCLREMGGRLTRAAAGHPDEGPVRPA
ncbi:WYL domain-containing protein, partial [Streptomyces sp. NPDC005904]|uniref:helix-turn-helix transcriptional regulator n=1 Tax=Streptomyces sp. NPDC005904 TaxID=3154570 RepID=UPI0033E0AA5A